MTNKQVIRVLKELSNWANPRVEVIYLEPSINKDAIQRCSVVGYLISSDVGSLFPGEVEIVPIQKGLVVYRTPNIELEKPIRIKIPLDSILDIKLLVPKNKELELESE